MQHTPVSANTSRFVIVAIQNMLSVLNYYSGKSDGKIRNDTEVAIKSFQEKHGLEVDGVPSNKLLVHLSIAIKNKYLN